MEYSYSGEGGSYSIPLRVDGTLVTPDENSVYTTFRGNNGAPLTGRNNILYPTTATTTEVILTATALENTKGTVNTLEQRFIDVKFTVSGAIYRTTFNYILVDSSARLISVTPADVRAVLGVNYSEVPDEDVDILGTWLNIQTTALNLALSSGSVSTLSALRVIKLTEAQRLLPSLRLRTAQSEGDNTIKFTRFANINWEALENRISWELSESWDELDSTQTLTPVMGLMSVPTDPITGE